MWVCMCACMCVHHRGRSGPSAQLPSRQGGLAGDPDISVSTLWPLCPPLGGSMKPSSPPEAVLFPRLCGAARSPCEESRLQCTEMFVAFPTDVCVLCFCRGSDYPLSLLKGGFPSFHLHSLIWVRGGVGLVCSCLCAKGGSGDMSLQMSTNKLFNL